MYGRPTERRDPAYDLAGVQREFAEGRFQITRRVLKHLDRRGWSSARIRSCVAALTPTDFHKSQAHLTRRGVWLDIYRPVFRGERLYVKFTLQEDGVRYRVLSFCGDGEEH
ncbi:MAG TPA: type II toxin-antitoxin system MqsR family toxin [Coriobacteriia bacterium]